METGPIDEQLSARSWQITRRWHEFEGETRVAILRVFLVAAFYGLQLLHYFFLADQTETERQFHRQVSAIAAAWLFVSLGVLVALRQRLFPPALKFVTTLFDLSLVTVCASLGGGPNSPLVSCYFLVISATAVRLSLPLIWCGTLGAVAGYMILVGLRDATWFDAEHVTPLVQQLISVLALLSTGVIAGQLVRMTANSATEYSARLRHLASLEGLARSDSDDRVATKSNPLEANDEQ